MASALEKAKAKQALTLSTVNVLVFTDHTTTAVDVMVSFPDNTSGNEDAEQLFRDVLVEQVNSNRDAGDVFVSENDIADALDNGYYEHGLWKIIIVHSTGDVATAKEQAVEFASTK